MDTLNDQQLEAVNYQNGPLLVLAGAGSGKTKVLTHKVTYFVQNKIVAAENCLLLTFTNKAAKEMRERISKLLSDTTNNSGDIGFAGTFHSFCAKMLRIDGAKIGLEPNFVIYDDSDQKDLIKEIIQKLNLSESIKVGFLQNTISEAKNMHLSPNEYAEIANSQMARQAADVYTLYQKRLLENNAVDFDDLLIKAVELLGDKKVLEKWQRNISYIFIDEWQDTNKVQYKLVKLLDGGRGRLTAVGDASQSIYSWRGADYRNINYLMKDYPKIKVVNLEQNYRSSQIILEAANCVINKNTGHPILKLWTDKNGGEKIKLYSARNGFDEAEYVINEIKNLNRLSTKLKDIAVLYRTNAQSRVIEEALLHGGLPYTIVGGLRFYDRKEIKDVLSYLRVVMNPKDTVSQKRAMGLGKRRYQNLIGTLDKIDIKVNSTIDILDTVLSSTGYLQKFSQDDPEDAPRIDNIKELRSVAIEYQSLIEFLENVSLVESGNDKKEEQDAVTLMTVHSAKGLEFKAVFVVGLEEGIFPHSRSLWDKEQLEEERRLMYVAITRAKEYLHLSFASKRLFYGETSSNAPSRFLSDIPEELLDNKLDRNANIDDTQDFKTSYNNDELNFDDILDKYLK